MSDELQSKAASPMDAASVDAPQEARLDATPRPWPENALPTAEQLAEWLTRCTDEERVTLCAKMLDSSERAHRCFMQHHDGLLEQVRHLTRRASEAYEQGWDDAVTKALEAVHDA